ncbi:MAG: leucine-rich repeat protein, partial [Solirubrobacterales bacterium]|nr:leucine-rich repeat protein [Solirubrobacterales bacterium]
MPAAASRLSRNTAVNRSACRTVMLVALSIAAASLVGLSQAAPASANYGNGVEYSVIAGANPGEWAAAVSGCDGTCPASLTIPAVIFNFTFGPLRVTEIADGGFNIGTSVPKRVNLPTTIKKIGAGAFSSSGPSNLERIDLPASLETIGQGAFAGTSSLTAVVFYGDAPEVLYDPASSLSPAFFQAGGFSGPATAYVADSTLGTYGPDGSFFANLTVSYERPPGGFAPTALTYENRGDSVAVTGCDGPCPASVTIPATIEGLPVLTVEGQFVKPDEDSYQLKAVTLPDGIQSIGSQAFANA